MIASGAKVEAIDAASRKKISKSMNIRNLLHENQENSRVNSKTLINK